MSDFKIIAIALTVWTSAIIVTGFSLGCIMTISHLIQESVLGLIGICYG
jgi:hypothetical protein